jgi:hypothetical protein
LISLEVDILVKKFWIVLLLILSAGQVIANGSADETLLLSAAIVVPGHDDEPVAISISPPKSVLIKCSGPHLWSMPSNRIIIIQGHNLRGTVEEYFVLSSNPSISDLDYCRYLRKLVGNLVVGGPSIEIKIQGNKIMNFYPLKGP